MLNKFVKFIFDSFAVSIKIRKHYDRGIRDNPCISSLINQNIKMHALGVFYSFSKRNERPVSSCDDQPWKCISVLSTPLKYWFWNMFLNFALAFYVSCQILKYMDQNIRFARFEFLYPSHSNRHENIYLSLFLVD